MAQESAEKKTISEKIDGLVGPVAKFCDGTIFFSVPVGNGQKLPVVLALLAGTAIFLTIYFRFINLRSFKLAFRTVRGRYSKKDDPGQITHFQALATALSATVGLGNIAGVAVAIGLGGPGAVFWMVIMGLLGMTSKFTECTLGVRYRDIDAKGNVQGGGMRYLSKGLAEIGLGPIGEALAIIFAVACIGGAIGAGNMFQINQSTSQVVETFGMDKDKSIFFGLLLALIVGSVILGGIRSIANVTSFLVPIMTITYVLACLIVLGGHLSAIPSALGVIVKEAFAPTALAGGFVGGLIQGIKRGVFSNEAGLGSAAIAHAPVKTTKPASEGIVALLEPFIDTVVICLMTALVIVVTGVWKADASLKDEAALYEKPESTVVVQSVGSGALVKVESIPMHELAATSLEHATKGNIEWVRVRVKESEKVGYMQAENLEKVGGIGLTSRSFATVIPWFPFVLTVAVVLFAFSTMISWYYYGEQALGYLSGGKPAAIVVFKIFFCLCVVIGSAASLDNVILLSDAMYFAMVFPNLIGIYFLLPVVKKELEKFQRFAKRVDEGASLDEAAEE